MFWPALLFLARAAAETFYFAGPGNTVELRFRLDANNINSGWFLAEGDSNLTYSVDISSFDGKKVLFRVPRLVPEEQTHFSFSNAQTQDARLRITAQLANTAEPPSEGLCSMRFESVLDSFNPDVAKKTQMEPAIYSLEKLLKQINDLTTSTRSVSKKAQTLGQLGKSAFFVIVLYNLATPLFYLVVSVLQLRLLRNRLLQKKM